MPTSISNQIEALSKIGKAITSDLYLEEILKLIVTVTAQATGSKICSLMLLDEKTQELKIRATQSISSEYNEKPPLKVGEGVAGKVMLDRKPLMVLDVATKKEYKYKHIAEKEGLASLLCVPLLVKKRAIGVINLYSSKKHKFTKNEVNVLNAIANQAAMVIENTELMVKTKVIQEELESRKIIEKAKGILMRQQGLSEDKAFRIMQKHSMDSRKSMRQIADAIVLSSEISKK